MKPRFRIGSAAAAVLAAATAAMFPPQTASARSVVRVEGRPGAWRLTVDGKPFFVHGAGGDASKAVLKRNGGNAFRTWGAERLAENLAEARANGLMLMAGFWLGHAEHGFSYVDRAALESSRAVILAKVREFKDDDALLCWALGNEMEMNNPHRREMWEFIDSLAVEIKAIDPDHPVCTVVAEIGGGTPREFDELAPHLDFLGINTYGGCPTIGERWRAAGMKRPYLVTEFGARGGWETAKGVNGLPLEQTSTEKGEYFAKSYREGILAERGKTCLGSFAFAWGWKIEATPTWHGIFLPDGTSIAATEALGTLWGGAPAANRVPLIEPVKTSAVAPLAPGETFEASVAGRDPDGDALSWKWVLLSDTDNYDVVGASLPMPPGWDDAIVAGQGTTKATVRLPGGGNYRLYAYCFDGKGAAAYANVPVAGTGQAPKPVPRPAAMPVSVFDDKTGPWIPSGYMGNTRALKVDEACAESPFSGSACIRVDYLDHIGWAGIFWQNPANDWGEKPGGLNLADATTLVFRARGLHGGEKVTFFMGGLKDKPFSDTAEAKLENVVLKKEWTRYRIPLDGLDLSCVKTGFGFTLANDGEPFAFFLDDIRYVAD
ncbi:MAG: hypothetical protein IJ783_05590 [Kiritimatiellae bacterium]|nr:hypothetical protein [Kiritimatiellia bacterium]